MTTASEFREFGKAMVDFVADYLENIRERPVLPAVKPGYLKEMLPEEAPADPEVYTLFQGTNMGCRMHDQCALERAVSSVK